MKEKFRYKAFGILAVIALLLGACNEQNNLGMDLLPSTDLISVKSTVIKDEISSFTHREDSVKTDEATTSLLGSINDPVFGNTTVDFATQFRLQTFPDFGDNSGVDSVRLHMYYRLIYGDTVTTQKFKVYELESPLYTDNSYYHGVDLKSYASDVLLGELDYVPLVKQDSSTADTFYQLITIPLDNSLGEKLLNADSTVMAKNDDFLDFFKGLYIESEKISQEGGTILSLESTQGSALVVYYNNDSTRSFENDTSFTKPYWITSYSARVNSFKHDYSGTSFEANLNSETNQDSLIFIQANGGLQSKIFIDNLSSWKDSVNTAINKAELIFQIDTTASDIHNFAPPQQLLFTVINEDGRDYLPDDYFFSPTFYGGTLRSDYTYHFNITQHIQKIIDGDAENYGFYLTTAEKSNQANRVVLKGSTSQTGIEMIVSYSKFLQ